MCKDKIYCSILVLPFSAPSSDSSQNQPCLAAAGDELASASQTAAVQLVELVVGHGDGRALLDGDLVLGGAAAAARVELATAAETAAVELAELTVGQGGGVADGYCGG